MDKLVEVAAQYGIAGVALLALGYLAYKIGVRQVEATDRLALAFAANTKANEDNTKAMTAAFVIATKEIGLAIGNSHTIMAQRVGELSERIARVEVQLSVNDPDRVT